MKVKKKDLNQKIRPFKSFQTVPSPQLSNHVLKRGQQSIILYIYAYMFALAIFFLSYVLLPMQ
jgi:hypothetical protein